MYETIMKRYVKQKIKQKIKLYLTHVSVQRMKEQHGETKRSVKQRRKEIRNTTLDAFPCDFLPTLGG